MKPTENTDLLKSNYEAIGHDGLPIKGKKVSDGSVIVSKVVPSKAGADGVIRFKDASLTLGLGEGGVVDEVVSHINGDGYKGCKVKIRKVRVPDIGDKFASRHAQKGIIGMVMPSEDMPFNKYGLTPDLIINPHAMPSRMTIGQFLESIMAKTGCMLGFEGDATAFTSIEVDDLCKLLGTPVSEGGAGFTEATMDDGTHRGYGNETLYNGATGAKLDCKIFMGPVYYLRSKHMCVDKFHSRAMGPTQQLTRQPPEGRARMGASRCGEMERDCLLAHGAANFLKEKFVDASDGYMVNIDRETGMLAVGDPRTGTLREGMTDVKQARMPYCMKLLTQELASVGIGMRFELG